ncbi:probable alpha,alpha-trehalose-phosphate synthase [UDP-forming] 8 [Typha angustifolia]|uniref:probable alpha,alpha-trehalose-phosphate synthase [UDP-forming] 8 n=1 Tax=Typha angustifolia TaxID=59011 RepID=UPI003C2E9652
MVMSNLSCGNQRIFISEDSPKLVVMQRTIIVANFLPLYSVKDQETGEFCFRWDESSLLLQMKDGFPAETEVIYVGNLNVTIDDEKEQETVYQKLYKEFRCVPTFLHHNLFDKFYFTFCKQKLWPLLHCSLNSCEHYDREPFNAYVSANMQFCEKVVGLIDSDSDCVLVQDYHLMLLPSFLRKRVCRIKLGFFLHSPFPPLEIFQTLPASEGILRGLLHSDLIGFQTFDYMRNFLSCCSGILGLHHEVKHGHIAVEHYGRKVTIRSLPVGVHLGWLESILNLPATITKVQEIEKEYKGMTLFVGVDDMDMFKGIILKLLAMEQMLQMYRYYRGKIVIVQIINPPRRKEQDVMETTSEVAFIAKRINEEFGGPGYTPVVLIDHFIPCSEKLAFYVAADCCIVTAIRDGMNLIPYEYIVCRQGSELMDRERCISSHSSMLILSEFIGCSQTLSRALCVNPYSTQSVVDALCEAMNLSEDKRKFHHKIHYNYIATHDLAYWTSRFVNDLEKACEGRRDGVYCNHGIGLGFKVVAYPPDLTELSFKHISLPYKAAKNRVIFLDYDGMIMSESCVYESPSAKTIAILDNLCRDSRNTVCILSKKGRNLLDAWLSSCVSLSAAAEHGYFIRWSKASARESTSLVSQDYEWRNFAELVMEFYNQTTNGSYIESNESSLAWHYKHADPEFGSSQAKALLDHLCYLLKDDPVIVDSAQDIVEVKPQGITKGLAAKKLIKKLIQSGKPPEFILCIAGDQSDELFERINKAAEGNAFPKSPQIFTCTSYRKPTNAKYYVTNVDKDDLELKLKGVREKPCSKELLEIFSGQEVGIF